MSPALAPQREVLVWLVRCPCSGVFGNYICHLWVHLRSDTGLCHPVAWCGDILRFIAHHLQIGLSQK